MRVRASSLGGPRDTDVTEERSSSKGKVRAVQFPVHNASYPRNRRVREYLESKGWECIPVLRGEGRETTLIEKVRAVIAVCRAVQSADVIILSEMSLKYAPITWALSRIRGAVHVVDGFIGLYETDVEDKKLVRESSLQAKLLHFQDYLAVRLADIYLVDTRMRAKTISRRFAHKQCVHSLPVGAPGWAHYREYHRSLDFPEVLYYGNYIPLHGLSDYVLAISSLPDAKRPRTRMIGNGQCFEEVRRMVKEHQLNDVFIFQNPVRETELSTAISQAKVVLGIFGSSNKAGSVIANKVWQGLASERRVVTRQSEALTEIADICRDLLVQVPAAAPEDLAAAITKAVDDELPTSSVGISARFESYVNGEFDSFFETLVCRIKQRRNRHLNLKAFADDSR